MQVGGSRLPLFGKTKPKAKARKQAAAKRADRRQEGRDRLRAKKAAHSGAKGPFGWLGRLFRRK